MSSKVTKKENRRFADRFLNLVQDFEFNQIGDLEQLFLNIPQVHFRHNVEGVKGWLRSNERDALYALARWLPGPILEVGPWVGLSTLIIANGIKDSKKEKFFVTYELNPKMENYRPVENGVGFFTLPEATVPAGVCSWDLFEKEIMPVVSSPGGVLGVLENNLNRFGMADLVQVLEGDFRNAPKLGYKFVFSDTMHDPNEISVNAPILRSFLSAGSVLACHDIDSTNEYHLRKYIEFGRTLQVDSLFIGEVLKDSRCLT